MTRYQPEESYYDENAYLPDEEMEYKRKRLTQSYPNPYGYRMHPAAEVVFWAFVGAVGLMLAIGSSIVASHNNGSEWVLVFPLIYMLGAMYTMRHR